MQRIESYALCLIASYRPLVYRDVMRPNQNRRRLLELLRELTDLHNELDELQSGAPSSATRRIYADIVEQCLRVQRLILANVLNAVKREAGPERRGTPTERNPLAALHHSPSFD